MSEYIPTLFNGSEHSLRLLEVWGVWLSSIGTLAAVLVALWLGLRSERLDLKVSAAVLQLYPSNSSQKFLVVRVSNNGSRPATIESINWTAGMFTWGVCPRKHGLMIVNPGDYGCSDLPTQLKDGDVASYLWEAKLFFDALRGDLTNKHYRSSFKLEVWTSSGKRFRIRPHKTVFTELDNLA